MSHRIASAVFVLTIAACGPTQKNDTNNVVVINGNPNNANSANVMPNNGTTGLSAEAQSIADAFNAPWDVHSAGEGGLYLTVEAVVGATIAATGGESLVTTGTLTQSGQSFSYAAGPNDRLVVKWTDGPQTDLYVSQLDGYFEAETLEEFFANDHVIEVRIVRQGFADFVVASTKANGGRNSSVRGMVTSEGLELQVDVQESGTTTSDNGVGTIDYSAEDTMTGSITGPGGLELVAQETFTFRAIRVDNFIENRSRTINSQWTQGGSQYAANEIFVRTEAKDSWPDVTDYWIAQGTVTQDGAVIGEVSFESDELSVDVILLLENGEKIRLNSYTLKQ